MLPGSSPSRPKSDREKITPLPTSLSLHVLAPAPPLPPPPQPVTVVLSPLLSSVYRPLRRVAGLVAVATEEWLGGGFSRRSSSVLHGPCIRVPVARKRIPVLPIPGVPSSHHPTLIVLLVNLRGGAARDEGAAADEAPWAEEEAGHSSANGATGLRIE